MKQACFTVDDNIRFLKELAARGCQSLFDHPYLAMLRRLHDRFALKVQLNLFYAMEGFSLADMTARYADEWRKNAHWLKLSFHSRAETVCPYLDADHDTVFADCNAVQREILRFASPESLAETTTVHYCRTTAGGLSALAENGVRGLLGLFGTAARPETSYGLDAETAARVRAGELVTQRGITFAPIDAVINRIKMEDLTAELSALFSRDTLFVMIHEQYFYEDYKAYQPDFEAKLQTVFALLREQGYTSCFFEELL